MTVVIVHLKVTEDIALGRIGETIANIVKRIAGITDIIRTRLGRQKNPFQWSCA
jgi:hypothetical protein